MFYDKTQIVSNLLSRADTFIAQKIYKIKNLQSLIEVLPPRLPSFVLSLSLNYSPGSAPSGACPLSPCTLYFANAPISASTLLLSLAHRSSH